MKLGTWVHTQRIQYRKLISGNTKGTGKEKGIANGELSPGGAIDPSLQYTEENASEIAAWSVEQAQSYRLTDARRIRLEEVGFCWSAREGNEKTTLETSGRITRNSYDDQWDAMFDLLVQYKEQYRDCLVVSGLVRLGGFLLFLVKHTRTHWLFLLFIDIPAKAISGKPQARDMGGYTAGTIQGKHSPRK